MNAGVQQTVKALTLLGSLGLAAGCATTGALLGGGSDKPDPDIIAQDLVYTLTQVPALHPLKTTLQVSDPITPFGDSVVAHLKEAGYGMQRVAADHGPHYLRYRNEFAESETGERRIYSVSIGEVSVERDYVVSGSETVPGSAQIVRGADSTPIEPNESLYGESVSEQFRQVRFVSDGEPEIRDMRLASMRPAIGDDVVSIAAASPAVAPTLAETRADITFKSLVKRNMDELMTSNFADLFADYEDIESDVLMFPNDSLRLGEANKETIARYVRELDPATDVLSVVGCSHGQTNINNGNELLAIGRANRVKEAFMFAGISHDQVLEESCWASDYNEEFPRRGVVLTLKRKLG